MQAQVDFLKHLLDPECTLDWKIKYNVHHLCHQKMTFVKQCITDVIQENDIQLTPFGIYVLIQFHKTLTLKNIIIVLVYMQFHGFFFSVQHLEELILDENLRITKIESETAKDALKIVYDKVLHDLVDSEKVQKLKEILNLLQKNSRKRNDLGLVFNGYRENPSFLKSVSCTDNFNLVKRIVDR